MEYVAKEPNTVRKIVEALRKQAYANFAYVKEVLDRPNHVEFYYHAPQAGIENLTGEQLLGFNRIVFRWREAPNSHFTPIRLAGGRPLTGLTLDYLRELQAVQPERAAVLQRLLNGADLITPDRHVPELAEVFYDTTDGFAALDHSNGLLTFSLRVPTFLFYERNFIQQVFDWVDKGEHPETTIWRDSYAETAAQRMADPDCAMRSEFDPSQLLWTVSMPAPVDRLRDPRVTPDPILAELKALQVYVFAYGPDYVTRLHGIEQGFIEQAKQWDGTGTRLKAFFTTFSQFGESRTESAPIPRSVDEQPMWQVVGGNCLTFKADTPLWQVREMSRLAAGHYQPLPSEVLAVIDRDALPEHSFPHLAVDKDHLGQIAITRDERAGVADRQVTIRAGKFIRQYANPGVTDEMVKKLAGELASGLDIHYELTTDRKEISRVYQRGPSSCMAYGPGSTKGHFDNPECLEVDGEFVHPCEVYAHPDNDLALLYGTIRNGKEIVSRAIVNLKDKTFCRTYAKESPAHAAVAIREHLTQQMGCRESDHVLQGQKLLKIVTDTRAVICPYLDPGNVGVAINSDCLRIGGHLQANHSTGTLEKYDGTGSHSRYDVDYSPDDDGEPEVSWTCICCGGLHYDGDGEYRLDADGDEVCDSCVSEFYTEAYSVSAQETVVVRTDDSDLYELIGENLPGDFGDCTQVYAPRTNAARTRYGLVVLDDNYHDACLMAPQDECTQVEDGGWVLTSELDSFNLFLNPDSGEACDIDDYVVVRYPDGREELVAESCFDEDAHRRLSSEECAEDPALEMLYVWEPIVDEEEGDEPDEADPEVDAA